MRKRGSVSGGSLFCGFFLFFCSITIKYYNEVVSHSNYQNPYALCSSSHTAFRLIELLSFISILIADRYNFKKQHQSHRQGAEKAPWWLSTV